MTASVCALLAAGRSLDAGGMSAGALFWFAGRLLGLAQVRGDDLLEPSMGDLVDGRGFRGARVVTHAESDAPQARQPVLDDEDEDHSEAAGWRRQVDLEAFVKRGLVPALGIASTQLCERHAVGFVKPSRGECDCASIGAGSLQVIRERRLVEVDLGMAPPGGYSSALAVRRQKRPVLGLERRELLRCRSPLAVAGGDALDAEVSSVRSSTAGQQLGELVELVFGVPVNERVYVLTGSHGSHDRTSDLLIERVNPGGRGCFDRGSWLGGAVVGETRR